MRFIRENKWTISFLVASVTIAVALRLGSMAYGYPYPWSVSMPLCFLLGGCAGGFGAHLDNRSRP